MKNIHNRFLLAMLGVCATSLLFAQPMRYYRAVKASHSYTALTPTTGTQLVWAGPNNTPVTTHPIDLFSMDSIVIGFPFIFNGKTYTHLRPCSNGFILLGGKTGVATEYLPDWESGSAQNRDYIALWQESITCAGAYYKSSPTEFILQYQTVLYNETYPGETNPVDIQLRLVKDSQRIEYTGGTSSSGWARLYTPKATVGVYSASQPSRFVSVQIEDPSIASKLKFSDSVQYYNGGAFPVVASTFDFIIKRSRDLATTSVDGLPQEVPNVGQTITPKASYRNLGWDTMGVNEPVTIRYEIFNAYHEIVYANDTTLPQTLQGGVSGDLFQMEFRPWSVTDSSPGYVFRAISSAQNEDSLSFRLNDTVTRVVGDTAAGGVSVREVSGTPKNIFLGQNYPNPFSIATHIPFAVRGKGALEVLDRLGRQVYHRSINPSSAGVDIDGNLFGSGLYFYRLHSGNSSVARTMMVVR